MVNLLLKSYKFNPATIAFIDGIFLSTAINILTGIGTNDGFSKWIALASALTMMIGAVLLLVWQNSASKLQESYAIWTKPIIKRNTEVNDDKHQENSQWNTFIKKCNLPFALLKSKKIISNFERKHGVDIAKNEKLCRKLKKYYAVWVEHINNLNHAVVEENNKLKADWQAFFQECKLQEREPYIEKISETEILELPHYSIKRLVSYSWICCISLFISVVLMIWSFV